MKKIKTEMSARSQELKNKVKSRLSTTLKNRRFDKSSERRNWNNFVDEFSNSARKFIWDNRADIIDMYQIEQELKSADPKYSDTIKRIKEDVFWYFLRDVEEYADDSGEFGAKVKVYIGTFDETQIYYWVDLFEDDYDEIYFNKKSYLVADDDIPEIIEQFKSIFGDVNSAKKLIEATNELKGKLNKYMEKLEIFADEELEDDRYSNELEYKVTYEDGTTDTVTSYDADDNGCDAFSNYDNITKIEIPNGITKIPYILCRDMTKLKSVTIPDGVTSIGWGAFYDCNNLKSVKVPKNCKIENNAFSKDCEVIKDGSSKANESIKRLNVTKEAFNKSRYFQNKYGKLEYVSESGKLFKTDKGQVIKFVND